MEEIKKSQKENYDYIYDDYFNDKNGDADDMIFSALREDKNHSEK